MNDEDKIAIGVVGLFGGVIIYHAMTTTPQPSTQLSPTNFVKKYWADALENQRATTVPALVTMAQAALESGWGGHAPGNNFFGIKASKSWTGPTVLKDTTEVYNGVPVHIKDYFRAYPDAKASFVDHGHFFLDNKRYAKALQHVNDPAEFIKQISLPVLNPGYATDPEYTSKIFSLMNTIRKILVQQKMI